MTGELVLLCRQGFAAAAENIVDLGMRRQETLGLAWGFVSAHQPTQQRKRQLRGIVNLPIGMKNRTAVDRDKLM